QSKEIMGMYCSVKRMGLRSARLLLIAGMCLALAGRVHADKAITPDSGKFRVTIQDSDAAVVTYKITVEGSEYEQKLTFGGANLTIHNTTKIKNGVLTEVSSDGGGGNKFLLTVAGEKSKIKIGDMAAKDTKLPARLYP